MAASDDMKSAAKMILERVPSLQYELNNRGETPMFRAACYGKKVMFNFLHEEMSKDNLSIDEKMNKGFLRRPDGSTILHMTVMAEHLAKVVMDANTGRSKGYGFVRFGDDNERTQAMADMNGVCCSSRAMRIGPATPRKSFGYQQQFSSQELDLKVEVIGVELAKNFTTFRQLHFGLKLKTPGNFLLETGLMKMEAKWKIKVDAA